MITLLLIALLLSPGHGTTAARGTADPLSLDVSPRACLSPGYFRARARIARHPENQRLVIVADSAAYFSSTTTYLDGDTDAVLHEEFFRRVPAGRYIVRATLTRRGGHTFVQELAVIVGGTPGH